MTREHHGMRFTPDGTFRRRGSPERPPVWWEHYYRDPETGLEHFLGRSERRRRHLEHRFYSVSGDYQVIYGWVNGVEWLLECWRSHVARTEAIRVREDEEVREE